MGNKIDPSPSRDDPWPYPRYWAACLLVLVAATERLWFPRGDFPRVPLVAWAMGRTIAWDWAIGVCLVGAAGLLLAGPTRVRRSAAATLAVALGLSFLFDQHRLQPWAYQSALVATAVACWDRREARRWLIVLAASIYLYSASGKIDYQFAHTVGREFLETAAQPLGGLPAGWDAADTAPLTLLFPTVELLIGIGWLIPPLRRPAGWAAIGMHGTLLGLLGPWGLGHSAGVLVWNAALVGQAYWLAIRPDPMGGTYPPAGSSMSPAESSMKTPASPGQRPDAGSPTGPQAAASTGRRKTDRVLAWSARGLFLAALLLPLVERRGHWDHWPSWALYSPHNSRVTLQIHQSAAPRLPAGAIAALAPDRDGDGWRRMDLGAWSLSERGVPIYPQTRYQLAVAVALAETAGLRREIRAVVRGVSDRRTGRRPGTPLPSADSMRQALGRYLLVPRGFPPTPGER